MKTILALLIVATLAGCSTKKSAVADAPPKYAKHVQCVQYDTTPRPAKESIEVLVQPPNRKYKVIALLTAEGSYKEEVVMTRAIVYRARQLGADAVLQMDLSNASTGNGSIYGHMGGRSVFRFNAIVFE